MGVYKTHIEPFLMGPGFPVFVPALAGYDFHLNVAGGITRSGSAISQVNELAQGVQATTSSAVTMPTYVENALNGSPALNFHGNFAQHLNFGNRYNIGTGSRTVITLVSSDRGAVFSKGWAGSGNYRYSLAYSVADQVYSSYVRTTTGDKFVQGAALGWQVLVQRFDRADADTGHSFFISGAKYAGPLDNQGANMVTSVAYLVGAYWGTSAGTSLYAPSNLNGQIVFQVGYPFALSDGQIISETNRIKTLYNLP